MCLSKCDVEDISTYDMWCFESNAFGKFAWI